MEEEEKKFEINSVQYILRNIPIPYRQKILIKEKGRPVPELQINFTRISKTRTYNRRFNRSIYDKYEWMCGCPMTNKLFCFVCLLCKGSVSVWTKDGVNDLKHIAERSKQHQSSVNHLNAYVDFSVLGKTDIGDQLDSTYWRNRMKHNEEVEKNRHILRRLITCIKFCGAFELALRDRDKSISSDSAGSYAGLISFATELDALLAVHLKDANVFKGTSKTIQNELLDAVFAVYRTELIKQINSADFIALQANEITDASNNRQMVIIIRYVFNGQIYERFWSCIRLAEYTAEQLASVIVAELQHILSSSDNLKLIAQSYDGVSVMGRNDNSVQDIIRKMFPYAYYIHCYAHQFNLIMQQATHCHKQVKIFFAILQSFSSFFSHSPKRIAVLDEVVHKVLPRGAPTQWNFKSRTVNTLFEFKDSIIDCLEKISDENAVDSQTLREACNLLNHLRNLEFLYWLKIFHFIMPHVEVLFNQAQAPGIESLQLQNAVEKFAQQIMRIRSTVDHIEPPKKRPKTTSAGDSRSVIAREICNNILVQIKERFDFKDHLSAAKLFESRSFKIYRHAFPQQYFDETVKSYAMLDRAKLKTELTAIYERDDMCRLDGILSLLVFLSDNNLKTVLSETYQLVNIICTTPMTTAECERCFSTLKRINTFLKSTVSEDRLNALAVLSIEKTFIQCIPDFENKVIDIFGSAENRKIHFMWK